MPKGASPGYKANIKNILESPYPASEIHIHYIYMTKEEYIFHKIRNEEKKSQ